ncbi:MAG: hypothetical protein P1Q69_16275 [Candidatus Thorarchaeota archaeon]|nr:hypothetical protein [Candidatus Thorarchaeota archaeon]
MKIKRKQIVIVLFASFLFLALLGGVQVSAEPIEDDDGGGDGSDNIIANGNFEVNVDGWTASGVGSKSQYWRDYADDYSMKLDADSVPILIGYTWFYDCRYTVYQDVINEVVTEDTRLHFAMYLDHSSLWGSAVVTLGIDDNDADLNTDFYLHYYVSDTTNHGDFSFFGSKYYTFEISEDHDTWVADVRDIYSDLEDKGEDNHDYRITDVRCHVQGGGIGYTVTLDCVGLFDDLYIGSTPPDV